MATFTYIAIAEEAETGGYGVFFPDLPGCVSAGATLHEAVANASQALSFHLAGMVEDDEPLPEPRELDRVVADMGKPSAPFVYTSVSADVDGAGERVNVYLTKSLVAQIDAFGEATGIDNRSTFFRLAARRMIAAETVSPYRVTARFRRRLGNAECGDAAEAVAIGQAYLDQSAQSVVITHLGKAYSVEQLRATLAG